MEKRRADATRSELLGGVILVVLALSGVILLHCIFPREGETPGIHRVDEAPGSDFGACDIERQPALQSAIALRQPGWMKDPLDEWCVLDAASGMVVERVERSWAPRNIPAGAYRVRVRQYASDGMDITLPQIINVGEGERVRLKLCGGIKPEPADWVPAPYQWGIVNREEEYLQFASGRWDALLIPPGIHRVVIQPTADSARMLYAREVGVSSSGLTMVKIDSGIEPVPADWVSAPRQWAVTNREGKIVQRVTGTWERVVVPPGTYSLVVYPDAPEALPVCYPWGIEVKPGEVRSVPLDSGVTIEAASWVPTPHAWVVVDPAAKADVQTCKGGWDKLLIPPGRYDIHLLPEGKGSVRMPYINLDIPPRQLVVVKVDTGVEIDPEKWMGKPRSWTIRNAKTKKVVQHVQGKWGKVITPPGKYLIAVRPGGYNEKTVVFGPIDVQAGRLNQVALRSGVRLIGPDNTTPLSWSVVDAKTGEVVQTARGHWGSAIVPPGTYKITVRLSAKEGEREIVAAEKVVVGEGRSDVTVTPPKPED